MANVQEGLKYTDKHEWVRVEGDSAVVGISDYAQGALGDIVYVEMPDVGSNVAQFESFGTIESVKAAEDLYSPVSGEVTEINEELNDKPDAVNSDPYGAWMFRVKLQDAGELDNLKDAAAYKDYIDSLES